MSILIMIMLLTDYDQIALKMTAFDENEDDNGIHDAL